MAASLPCPATAQPSDTIATDVVLVCLAQCCAPYAWPAAEQRVRRELSLCNLSVTDADGPKALTTNNSNDNYRVALERARQNASAKGAILIVATPVGVVLHSLFLTASGHKTEYRYHRLTTAPTEGTVEVAALKTKEAVLAAFYPHKETSPPSGSDAPADTSVRKVKAPAVTVVRAPSPKPGQRNSRRIAIQGVSSVAWAPGGIGPIGTVGGKLAFHLSNRIAVGVKGEVSVFSKNIQTDDASASVRVILGRTQLAYLFSSAGPVLPKAGIQMGVEHFRSVGKSATLPVRHTDTTLFMFGLWGELAFVLNRHIHIPFTLGVGAVPPGVQIRFAGKPEANLNILLLEAGIGVTFLM